MGNVEEFKLNDGNVYIWNPLKQSIKALVKLFYCELDQSVIKLV